MLSSPTHAVIGASDPAATIRFLELFGFVVAGRATLPAAAATALYGLDGDAAEVELAVPGATLGWLRLVETPHPPHPVATLDNRPFAIDLFSTDLERSVGLAEEAGFAAGPIARHEFGPLVIREVEIVGPDHLILTLLESPARRPTILDRDPERLHSELHALVWSVDRMDDKLGFWQRDAGLETITDAVFEGEEMGKALGLPGRSIRARLVVMCDAESNPSRLELIEFLGEPAADHPNWPLAAGLHAPAFQVDDLEDALEALSAAVWGEIVELDSPLHRRSRAVTAEAPGRLRFELWQEAAPVA
jgi:hypothetical protein